LKALSSESGSGDRTRSCRPARSLFGAVHEFGARLIGKALEEAGGSVTKAARLLGIRHQSLLAMLNARHRKLLGKRKPQEKRKRSIIKD